jgi:hypothetical protein
MSQVYPLDRGTNFGYLTKLGNDGREMVNALPWWGRDVVMYYFKRPVE